MLASLEPILIGTDSMNDYIWESKYYWTTLGHDHENSPSEGLTVDLTQNHSIISG